MITPRVLSVRCVRRAYQSRAPARHGAHVPLSRDMKILVITSHHPSRRAPLHGIYSLYTYQALAEHSAVRIVSPAPWWSRLAASSELLRTPRERWGSVDAEYPSYWSVPGVTSVHAVAMAASLARRVGALRREFPFDVIMTAWAYPDAVAAALVAARHRVPLVATVLGSDINALPRRATLGPQIRWALGRAQRIVAVSEALATEVARLGIPRERIRVQHNGVDGGVFTIGDREDARAGLGLARGRRLVGYVGRLSGEKGLDVLLDAFGHVVRSDPRPIDLAIVGAGPMERDLRAQAARLRLDGRVSFLGHRGHDELPRWLRAFDVLCLPSRREGCPNVVLESLASGRPVVASRVGGVPELLRDENGVLVPPEDFAALAAALSGALDRRWDPAALRATVPCLSWANVGRTYQRLAEEATAELGARAL
jgi:glycosyltransferase involved in cell wall biosynthesis